MSSLHFVVHPLPGTEDQLNDRIREVADKINKYGSQTPQALQALKVPVKQIVIGPAHLGLLLEDGRAFRVAFSIIPERLDLSKHEPSKSSGSGQVNNSGSKNSPGTSRQLPRSRARIMRTTATARASAGGSGSRSTGVIIGSSSGRSMVSMPAPFVPEDLINQAQVVLQGKSRNVIIRELQRTNLDVNLAVNNLLSRDDEEGEDTEEGSDNYAPEDFMSLLDSGFPNAGSSVLIDADAMFSEEMFGYSSIRNRVRSERNQSNNSSNNDVQSNRSGGTSNNLGSLVSNEIADGAGNNTGAASGNNEGGSSNSNSVRDSFSRWRDRQYYGPKRWFHSSREESAWDKEPDMKKKESSSGLPLWISDELEYWPEKDAAIRFTHIAALHSEFIGVSTKGELHQWRWCDIDPYKNLENPNVHHPKTISLNLLYEKIKHISATSIRCTVATESNRVATWMDELLGTAGTKLEHNNVLSHDMGSDKISNVYTCALYTVVKTENNSLFWWGVLPFNQRKKLWDRYMTKSKKPMRSNSSTSDVVVGAQVCMKTSPMYQSGAIAFTISNGVPKVGQLLNDAWDLNDSCLFKILNMTPPVAVSSNNSGTASCSSLTTNDLRDLIKFTINLSANTPNQMTSSSNTTKSSGSGNNKETADRLDMPPPPSPASSTCSDTGSVTSHKRAKRSFPKEDNEKKDEEKWHLGDVVFVEDVRSGAIGRVLKVDGAYAVIKFPPSADSSKEESDDLKDCRILRKDELLVMKSANTPRGPDCFQKNPRRVYLTPNQQPSTSTTPTAANDAIANIQLLTIAVDSKGIHAIMRMGNKLHYSLFNLITGKQEHDSMFPTDINAFLGLSQSNVSLTCANECSQSVLILRDGNNTIYPLSKDCVEAIRDPNWLDLQPIRCIAASTHMLQSIGANLKSQVAIVAFVPEQQLLMQRILRCDLKGVQNVIQHLNETPEQIQIILNERCDGNRNIIHACVAMCSPTSNKDPVDNDLGLNREKSNDAECINLGTNNSSGNNSSSTQNRHGQLTLREMIRKASQGQGRCVEADEVCYSSMPSFSQMASDSDDDDNSNQQHQTQNVVCVSDPVERRECAMQILKNIFSNSYLQPYLKQFLSARDAQGQTPFMLAIAARAYGAAKLIFKTIKQVAGEDPVVRDSMIFPPESHPDQNPLYVLCCNDTCSFTWTGADHINQDIFECKTCGLTESLCCCTECAKVCHKGHDCKLKRTSPTAYCDCWEKCKCKALIAGDQTARFELLTYIAKQTDLVTRTNSRGESILLFLIQTAGRQGVEQRQYLSRPRNSSSNRKTTAMDTDSNMPDHDLEPPRFARKALDRLLIDWPAVRSMIMTGPEQELPSATPNQVFYDDSDNQTMYLRSQSGTTLLDKFTHSLFVRCNHVSFDTLLGTLSEELQNHQIPGRIEEAQKVARRFVRSVARVFVIFSLEKQPNPEKIRNPTKAKYLPLCRQVFETLLKISIEELIETADALIAPVRMGVVRPTAPFSTGTSSLDNSEDLFSVDPLTPSARLVAGLSGLDAGTSSSRNDTDQATGFMSQLNVGFRLRSGGDNTESDAAVGEDGDASEHEEVSDMSHFSRQFSRSNRNLSDYVTESLGDLAGQEGESDPELGFQEGETESDSDDNMSTQDAQRSVQTGATAGSDAGENSIFIRYEDESDGSSQPDEDGSDDGETDDHSQDGYLLADEQLERRPANSGSQRNNLAPQSMQWAVSNRETARTSVRLNGNSNLMFIDPGALRRTTTSSSSTVTASQESHSMSTTASSLARAFGIVLREVSVLFNSITDACAGGALASLKITYQEANDLHLYLENRLKPTWDWMLSVMDSTEAQLRFGASLTHSSDPSHPLHPMHPTSSTTGSGPTTTAGAINSLTSNQSRVRTLVDGGQGSSGVNTRIVSSFNNDGARSFDRDGIVQSRREFLSYCLSLMRAHSSEHRDSLPVLDVSALRHIAYVLDGIIFYMRSGRENDTEKSDSNMWADQDENENDDLDDGIPIGDDIETLNEDNTFGSSLGERHTFFQRSESTLCLGTPSPDPFNTTMFEALPLADKPHLLQRNAKREDLFGSQKHAITVPTTGVNPPGTFSPLELPPIHLGLSTSNQVKKNPSDISGYEGTSAETTEEITITEVVYPPQDNKETDVDQTNQMIQVPMTSEPKPSTSRDTGGSSSSQGVENYGNIYLQLKKKTYIEQYDDESGRKSMIEMKSMDEGPQDLSCSKESLNRTAKMEVDSEVDNATDSWMHEYREVQHRNNQMSSSNSVRPEIIVTPRKAATASDQLASGSSSNSGTTNQPLNTCDLGGAQSVSPSKSVIVRAGPSNCPSSADVIPMDTMDNQTMSHVTIESTVMSQPPQEMLPRGQYFSDIATIPKTICGGAPTWDLLLGRWKLSLDIFGRVFNDDVGLEPGSIVSELRGFPMKETRFRRMMEKLRNTQQRDLILTDLERNRSSLIVKTFKEFNTQFTNQKNRSYPPLAFSRVKVTFKDEPGEGSGVTRSFYTSIAEALVENEKLPNLESTGSSKFSVAFSNVLPYRSSSRSGGGSNNLHLSTRRGRHIWRTINREATSSKALSIDARPYRPISYNPDGTTSNANANEHLSVAFQTLGEQIYTKVFAFQPGNAQKITGMLLGLPLTEIRMILTSDETLRMKVDEAMDIIMLKQRGGGESENSSTGFASGSTAAPSSSPNSSGANNSSSHSKKILVIEEYQLEDNAPLFYSPGKRGFYSPRQGCYNQDRLNAFRNVGRLIGLCLLQNELFPLFLQRHVLKFILGRRIRFHDLAFFDHVVYESLRNIVKCSRTDASYLTNLELNFVIDLCAEEGGGSVELVPGGRDIQVNRNNVYDYVRLYSIHRMVRTQERALEAIRSGVFDVLPTYALDSLTAEDLRLLLNGVGDIHVGTLISYTTFNDESNESSEKLVKFKRWLWSIVEKMSNVERQDLVYFWTGSPALPASEEGFQPMPSVTIRPADDAHFPTANTCISRLYIPLYSSKAVLKSKLLVAIKTKIFGFV